MHVDANAAHGESLICTCPGAALIVFELLSTDQFEYRSMAVLSFRHLDNGRAVQEQRAAHRDLHMGTVDSSVWLLGPADGSPHGFPGGDQPSPNAFDLRVPSEDAGRLPLHIVKDVDEPYWDDLHVFLVRPGRSLRIESAFDESWGDAEHEGAGDLARGRATGRAGSREESRRAERPAAAEGPRLLTTHLGDLMIVDTTRDAGQTGKPRNCWLLRPLAAGNA